MGQNRDLSKFPNAITVLDNGNVGIGTTSFSEGTQPTGTISIIPNSSVSSGPLIQFAGNGRIRPASTGDRLSIDGNALFLNSVFGGNIIMATGGGNVGIGTSSPSLKLQIECATGDGMYLRSSLTTTGAADTGAVFAFAVNDGTSTRDAVYIKGLKENSTIGNYASYLSFFTRPNGGSPIERMRIQSGGDVIMRYNVSLGNTASDAPAVITFQNIINGYQFGFQSIGTDRFTFVNGAPTEVGYLTGGGVFYSSGGGTSDRRMKQNIEYIETSGLNAIDLLKPASFEFIDNPEKKRRGFIAQDVLEVIPDLVLGNGDEEKGIYGLDYDGILALAIKAIQELNDKVSALENKS
jgi:hypothetical protein